MPWAWNESSHRYHDTDTGRFMARTEVLGYVEASLEAAKIAPAAVLEGGVHSAGTDMLSNLVANDLLSPRDWHEQMREQVKREVLRQYMLGKGGRAQMTAEDWGSCGGIIADQYRYLKDFARLVEEGALSEGQIKARAAMYVNSAREGFERGQARAFGLPDLPAYPGDGQTICLTNCACSWQIEEVFDEDGNLIGWNCYWTLGIVKTEHCPDCLENSQKWNPLFVGADGEIISSPMAPEEPWLGAGGQAPSGKDVTTKRLDGWLVEGLESKHWHGASKQVKRQAKDELVTALSERSGVPYDTVNDFVKQWSYSSNDNDMRSLAIQRAASETFGIPLSEFTQGKITALERKIAEGAIPQGRFAPLLPDDEQGLLLKAMYDYTQEKLALSGFSSGDTVRLRRGVVLPDYIAEDWDKGSIQQIIGNTLESWSVGENVASRFANAMGKGKVSVVLEMDVPVETIMGTARTGFGCLDEGEFVLLGSQPSQAKIIHITKWDEGWLEPEEDVGKEYAPLPPLDELAKMIGKK